MTNRGGFLSVRNKWNSLAFCAVKVYLAQYLPVSSSQHTNTLSTELQKADTPQPMST